MPRHLAVVATLVVVFAARPVSLADSLDHPAPSHTTITQNLSALHPAGPQARRSADVTLVGTVIAGVVVLTVILGLLAALFGRRPAPDGERRATLMVGSAVVLTGLVLAGFLGMSLAAGRGLTRTPPSPAAVIRLIGHQWWWEVKYEGAPAAQFSTANEIHIPVGRPVVFILESRDVIHSLWVPALGGKRDLVPGYTTSLWLQADHAGVYRGQCAEFCGLAHAKMGLLVVAEPEPAFRRWVGSQHRRAARPADEPARSGAVLFTRLQCALCHRVRGTPAGGTVGPDLTHLASRISLAAATFPNQRGWLGAWLLDPRHLKPGVHMPPTPLRGPELQQLLSYLEHLE